MIFANHFSSSNSSWECEMNKLRFLIGYFVHSFYFKSVIYVDIMNIFKVENMD